MLDWIPLAEWQALPLESGIYCIRHIESQREYVGQSKSIRERVASHRAAVSSHFFGRALRKHGLAAFEVCVLALAPADQLGDLEQEMIATRGTLVPAGFNISQGGAGPTGVLWSDERKLAQSVARTGTVVTESAKEKMRQARLKNNPFKGQKHSAETLVKISAATVRQHTGMKRSAETRANISASLKGRSPSVLSEAGRAAISLAQKTRVRGPGMAGEKNPMFGRAGHLAGVKGAAHPCSKEVGVWVPESTVPLRFGSVTEASKWAGVNVRTVCDWCSGKRQSKSPGSWAYL